MSLIFAIRDKFSFKGFLRCIVCCVVFSLNGASLSHWSIPAKSDLAWFWLNKLMHIALTMEKKIWSFHSLPCHYPLILGSSSSQQWFGVAEVQDKTMRLWDLRVANAQGYLQAPSGIPTAAFDLQVSQFELYPPQHHSPIYTTLTERDLSQDAWSQPCFEEEDCTLKTCSSSLLLEVWYLIWGNLLVGAMSESWQKLLAPLAFLHNLLRKCWGNGKAKLYLCLCTCNAADHVTHWWWLQW